MKLIDFKIPTRLDEARSILKKLGPDGHPLAGATALQFMPGKEGKTAVDITRIGMDGIQLESGTFIIGAATRIADLQKFKADGWVLDRAAIRMASQPIRNMGTLGGNICRLFPWADFPVVLLAMNAELIITGDTERTLTADEFFSSQPARLFQPGDLLTVVKVKALTAGSGFGYRKEKQSELGFSLATAAAMIERNGNKIRSARVAACAAIPLPKRLTDVESLLAGKPGTEAVFKEAVEKGMAGLKFKSNAGMSEEYIGHLATVMVRDALAEAWAQSKAGES